ncbi:hypothetical protein BZB76_2642 [Actinomadura pelletieri DSM 43383]|uniref:Uncharacterized protein n=1 Tax=Actinomadura pelletieri DSM 43383 TaxID=1120940 RepID=A0A495QUS7_9ACTN|nr:hypothetical protein [Actinomadura pelletieri]RKS77264.1 hypothetical protein BZB76_2642 [Actinomadura pelletieri DSM 43383]
MTEAVSSASVPSPASSLAFGIGPDGTYTRSGQAAAFVLGVATMLVFFPLMVVAALLYTRAETVFPENPRRARSLVNWSWISIAVPGIPGLIFGVFMAVYLLARWLG